MKNKFYIRAAVIIAQLILAGVFIYSGFVKIEEPKSFAEAIINYKLFPEFSINLIAIVIPWIELTAGILLLAGFYIKENSILIGSLLLLFNILVIIALARGLNINCGCFGAGDLTKVGVIKLLENLALFVLTYLTFQFDYMVLRIKKNK